MREGLSAISPRSMQGKISNALASDKGEGCINPFMALDEPESVRENNSLTSSDEVHKRYRELPGVVEQEYADVVKNEVVQKGELIGPEGEDLVSIQLPSINIPHFRFGLNGRAAWARATATWARCSSSASTRGATTGRSSTASAAR